MLTVCPVDAPGYNVAVARKLFARNLKSLREVELPLEPGLSVLVGPNASGKSTLLLLGAAVDTAAGPDGPAAGVERWMGLRDLKHVDAGREEPVVLGAEADGVRWEVALSPAGPGLSPFPAEKLLIPGERVYDVAGGVAAFPWESDSIARDSRSVLRQLYDRGSTSRDKVEPALAAINRYRVYLDYVLPQLRDRGSPVSGHVSLRHNGYDAFSVLRNWRDRTDSRHRWELVRLGLRECFDWFAELDFESTAQVVTAQLVLRRRASPSISVASAANGWLAAMLHLCAIASADEEQMVAIDEFENALHPFAINRLLEVIDDYLRGRSIGVLLTSHSPTVLDWFDGRPERILVLKGDGMSPKRLTELRDPEWLAHFRLGQLFQSEGFSRA